MKKLLALLLALAMMFTLVACDSSDGSSANGGGGEAESTTAAPTPEELAEEVVEKELDEFMTMDSVEFFSALLESEETASFTETEKEATVGVLEAVRTPFEYEIISSEKIDDETVEVTLEVTCINGTVAAENFYQELMAYALQNAFADPQPTEEEMSIATMEIMISAFENAETVTKETTIEVVLEDGEWVVDEDEEDMFNLLCDNFITRMEEIGEEMENSFEG